MNFNQHSDLRGEHSFLSPSRYQWTNYDSAHLRHAYTRYLATVKGTELHDFASRAISLKIKMPKTKNVFNQYVNDAIGYRMVAEQVLFYSRNCFGTADAICFRDSKLRIHDLKTGILKTSMRQLEIYAALFCLEYVIDPHEIEIELRIYQKEIMVYKPEPIDILTVMGTIISHNEEVEKIRAEGI